MTHSCHLPLGHLDIFLMLRTWATCKKMISRSDLGAHVQRMPAGIGGVKWTVALNLDWLILSFWEYGTWWKIQRDIASWVILTIPDSWPIYTSSDFVLVVESVRWFLKIVDPKCSINNKELYYTHIICIVYINCFFSFFPKWNLYSKCLKQQPRIFPMLTCRSNTLMLMGIQLCR